jgi:hypothetical protein
MRSSHFERPSNHNSGEFALENPDKVSQGGESIPSSGKITLASEVLEGMQALSRDFDILSPAQVRSRLGALIQRELAANQRRESQVNELLSQRVTEEQLKYRQQFEKLKIEFDMETIKFEKFLKEKAQDIIKGLKIRQFDRLIDIGSRIRMIQTSHSKTKPLQE